MTSAGVLLLATLALSSASAAADPLPSYDGLMIFPAIPDPSGPSEFSWEVQLEEGQALEQMNDQLARVYETEDLVTVLEILPEAAHDASGASVPTSLGVIGDTVITLFVHHQAGDPTAGGTPFEYPITAGEGWEGGFVTHHVQIRPAETQAPLGPELPEANVNCVVPKLTGRTLRGAKRRLRSSNCRIGKVHKLRSATSWARRVAKQHPKAGRVLGPEATVDLTLLKSS